MLDPDEAEVLGLLERHGPLRTGRDTDYIVCGQTVARLKREGLVKVRRFGLDVRPDPQGPIMRAVITELGRKHLHAARDAVR